MQYLITPQSFNKYSRLLLPIFSAAACIFFLAGIYFALIASPPDYQQGETVRIMYVHVPSAWLSLGVYLSLTLSAASYLIWRNPLSGIFLKCSIPIGAIFCLICLITGALWGRPIWGVYWAWDARLTSMLVLFFLYLGLYILYMSYEDEEKASRATAVLAIIGVVNLPVIRFSVKWWNTLHQPASVMRLDKPALSPEMLVPLLVMFAFFLFLFLSLLLLSVKTEILKRKNRRVSANIILQQNK